jgi:hypothetical protein
MKNLNMGEGFAERSLIVHEFLKRVAPRMVEIQ